MNNKIESEQKGGSRAGFKALRIFRTVFIYVLAAGIIISALMFAASVNPSKSLFGYRYYTVLTPSMEPAYSVMGIYLAPSRKQAEEETQSENGDASVDSPPVTEATSKSEMSTAAIIS